MAHPPRSNPPLRFSSGPPNPCITPSTERLVVVLNLMSWPPPRTTAAGPSDPRCFFQTSTLALLVPLIGALSNPDVQKHLAYLHSLAESPDVKDKSLRLPSGAKPWSSAHRLLHKGADRLLFGGG